MLVLFDGFLDYVEEAALAEMHADGLWEGEDGASVDCAFAALLGRIFECNPTANHTWSDARAWDL